MTEHYFFFSYTFFRQYGNKQKRRDDNNYCSIEANDWRDLSRVCVFLSHYRPSGLPAVNLSSTFLSSPLHCDFSISISHKWNAVRDLTVRAVNLKIAVIGVASIVCPALLNSIKNLSEYTEFYLSDTDPELHRLVSYLRKLIAAEVFVFPNLYVIAARLRGVDLVVVAAANYGVS